MRISFLLLGREFKLHRCEGAFAADDCTAEIAIDALFDHRDTLRVLGFHNFDIVEVADNLIKVREAVWVESDLIEHRRLISTTFGRGSLPNMAFKLRLT